MITLRAYCLILLSEDKLILNIEDIQGIKVIKFPGGGILNNESPIQTILREVKEECGIILKKVSLFYVLESLVDSYFNKVCKVVSIYGISYFNESFIPNSQIITLSINKISPSILSFWNDRVALRKFMKTIYPKLDFCIFHQTY